MPNEYSRRQNTDGYQSQIQRRINLGEDLLHAVRAIAKGFDDLTERDRNVAEWLAENRETARRIYSDGSVSERLPTATGIDLEEVSHQDILEQLDTIVSGQIKALRDLIQETRVWDGKEKVAA
jgi:hypothetical protein